MSKLIFMQNNLEKRQAILKKWFDFLNYTDEQLQNEYTDFVAAWDYISLARPFIARDLKGKLGRRPVAKRYGVTQATVRRIGIEIGIYKKK